MEKISGILPSSARVKNVDMKDAHPVRPGTPTFGRPEGVSNLARNTKLSSIDTYMERPMTDRQREELGRAKIVDRVSNGFFMKEPLRRTESPAASVEFSSKASVENLNLSSPPNDDAHEPFMVAAEDSASMEFDIDSDEPEFLMPGSYIDVEA
tara:strand:+ start:252 stop:710 length:459 start_codon:yes stop_codon:yes gene_type:complete